MIYGKRESRPGARRKAVRRQPLSEALEPRVLLAIDLGGTTPPTLPTIASANIGVAMVGQSTALQEAGTSVANLGSANGSGFDSFLIGAPTPNATGTSTTSAAYLVFGSQALTTGGAVTADWLSNVPNGRVGNFSQLGDLLQTNPITQVQNNSYNFNGVTFITSQQPNSLLGASVADAGLIRGRQAFLIGAPGGQAAGSTGGTGGTGRAYLVLGAANNGALAQRTIDLDNPTTAAQAGVTVITFVSSAQGAQLGASVAGIGNFLNDGSNAIAIGATQASISGSTTSGAVYVMTGNNIPTTPTTIDVTAIGQGSVPGLVIAGPSGGSRAGFSVGGSGADVNGDGVADVVIGAPGTVGNSGTAYVVYGGNLGPQTIVTNGYRSLSLARVGTAAGSTPAPVAGAAISGSANEQFGFSVAGAGDFNNDGVGDVIIGGPGYSTATGRAVLFYGGRNNVLSGVFPVDATPAAINSFIVTGTAAGDAAGSSVSAAAAVRSGQPNGILVGSPGYLSDRGAAYYLPGHGGLWVGTFSLSQAEDANTLAGLQMTATTPGFSVTTNAPRFGASVSGRLLSSGQTRTADGDLLGDFVVGAPGFTIINSANLAGAGMIVEGARIADSVGIPPASNVIVAQIVKIDESTTAPFVINATTPAAMTIVLAGGTTPGGQTFNPATDIDPTTIVVNGVAFPNATIAVDPSNPNQAILTISPRSSLNIPSGVSTLTVSGRTLATAPAANQPFSATAQVTTGGGPTPPTPGGGAVVTLPPGAFKPVTHTPAFGGSMVPSVEALSRYNYAPIPLRVALNQYMPKGGFRARLMAFHGQAIQGRQTNSGKLNKGQNFWTNGSRVFNTSKFQRNQAYKWTHPGRVVPVQLKTQTYVNRNVAAVKSH